MDLACLKKAGIVGLKLWVKAGCSPFPATEQWPGPPLGEPRQSPHPLAVLYSFEDKKQPQGKHTMQGCIGRGNGTGWGGGG